MLLSVNAYVKVKKGITFAHSPGRKVVPEAFPEARPALVSFSRPRPLFPSYARPPVAQNLDPSGD